MLCRFFVNLKKRRSVDRYIDALSARAFSSKGRKKKIKNIVLFDAAIEQRHDGITHDASMDTSDRAPRE
jgi:hypothetical protein